MIRKQEYREKAINLFMSNKMHADIVAQVNPEVDCVSEWIRRAIQNELNKIKQNEQL